MSEIGDSYFDDCYMLFILARIDCPTLWIYLLLRQCLDALEIKLMQSNCIRV